MWRSGRVRFSPQRALNDPFEFTATLDFHSIEQAFLEVERNKADFELDRPRFREMFPNLKDEQIDAALTAALDEMRARRPRLPEEFFQELMADAENNLLIFSCSANCESIPMWSHYTANHTGYQVGFDPNTMFAERTSHRHYPLRAHRISYVREAPPVAADDGPTFKFALQKLDDWQYEMEWRYLSKVDAADLRSPEASYFEFNRHAIRQVTFGLNASVDLVSRVQQEIENLRLDCELLRVTKSAGRYGFHRQPL